MKLLFRLFTPEDDICDRCVFLVYDTVPGKNPYPDVRCVSANRQAYLMLPEARNDSDGTCRFYSPSGGCKKL